jgi:ribosome-binding factor A
MDSTRQKKISRLVQKELGEIFRSEIREIVMGTMVSVTVARVTSDLSIAKIYLSIFPGEHKQEVFENICQNSATIRYMLGQRTGKQLRAIPELQFYIDDSLDYIDNIDKALRESE